MRILKVIQLKPIQINENGFVFPLSPLHTKIELDKKGKSDRKQHQITYQMDPRHYGNVGDCCDYMDNQKLLELEEKGMIRIVKAKISKP